MCAGPFSKGDRAEIVIRAQKMLLGNASDLSRETGMNYFTGTVVDRSYMGGEVSYFIELGAGREIHIISMMRTRLYNIGEAVSVQVAPHHCHLIPLE